MQMMLRKGLLGPVLFFFLACFKRELYWTLLQTASMSCEICKVFESQPRKAEGNLLLIWNLIGLAVEGSGCWELINTGRPILNPCFWYLTKPCPKALSKDCKKVVFVWLIECYSVTSFYTLQFYVTHQIQRLSKVSVMLYSLTNKRMFKVKADIPSLTFCTFLLHHTSNITLI